MKPFFYLTIMDVWRVQILNGMPHQIFCDYLEDKGVDTRLLRTEETKGFYITNSVEVNVDVDYVVLSNGDGHGYGRREYGYFDGDGESFDDAILELYDPGDGYGDGCGNKKGGGHL